MLHAKDFYRDFRKVVIVASGGSVDLKDIEMIKKCGYPIICVNNAYKLIENCNFVVAADLIWWMKHYETVKTHCSGAIFYTSSKQATRSFGLRFIDNNISPFLNSGALAIKLANEIGFKHAILYGFDCSNKRGTHFDGDHNNINHTIYYDTSDINNLLDLNIRRIYKDIEHYYNINEQQNINNVNTNFKRNTKSNIYLLNYKRDFNFNNRLLRSMYYFNKKKFSNINNSLNTNIKDIPKILKQIRDTNFNDKLDLNIIYNNNSVIVSRDIKIVLEGIEFKNPSTSDFTRWKKEHFQLSKQLTNLSVINASKYTELNIYPKRSLAAALK